MKGSIPRSPRAVEAAVEGPRPQTGAPFERRRTVAVREARRHGLIPLMPAHDRPSDAEYRDGDRRWPLEKAGE
ncbi:hypothetical protein GCM10009646_68500 [Streptomyces aureus]